MFPGQCGVPGPRKGIIEAGHPGCAGHWASVPSPPAVFCSWHLWLVPLGELLPVHEHLSRTPSCFRVMRPRALASRGASGSVGGLANAPLLSVSLASLGCRSCVPSWGPHCVQATLPTPPLPGQMRGRGCRWQVQVPARSGAGGATKGCGRPGGARSLCFCSPVPSAVACGGLCQWAQPPALPPPTPRG